MKSTLVAVLIALLASCSNNLYLQKIEYTPNVLPLDIGLSIQLDTSFTQQIITRNLPSGSSQKLMLGNAQTLAFLSALSAFQAKNKEPILQISVQLENISTAAASAAKSNFEAWLAYKITLKRTDNNRQATFIVKGYGLQKDYNYTDNTGYRKAISKAMRSAIAELCIKLPLLPITKNI